MSLTAYKPKLSILIFLFYTTHKNNPQGYFDIFLLNFLNLLMRRIHQFYALFYLPNQTQDKVKFFYKSCIRGTTSCRKHRGFFCNFLIIFCTKIVLLGLVRKATTNMKIYFKFTIIFTQIFDY